MENSSESIQAVLFAEVAGSVRLYEKLGAGEAQKAVDRCIKRMERSVEAFGGRIAKQLGSELMATFSQLDFAFQSAAEMRQKVADLPPVSGLKLEIRVGFVQGCVKEVDGEWAGDTVKKAAMLVGLAEPGEVLTDSSSQTALSPQFSQLTRDHGAFPAKCLFATSRIYQVLSTPVRTSVACDADALNEHVQQPGIRLLLRFEDKVFVLDDTNPTLRFGRNADNDVVIQGHRVSRHHARIEKRGGTFVFIDSSTNGSFLTPCGMPEVSLRRTESVFLGKGVISFAAHATASDADRIVYEVLQ